MSVADKTRLGRLQVRVDRVIYTTITMLSVLIIYDGWAHLRFWDVLAVIVGPILADLPEPCFPNRARGAGGCSQSLDVRERRNVLLEECKLLLLIAPPVVILAVLAAFGVSYPTIIQVIVLVGVLSLGFWGAVGGRRAGLTGWSLVGSCVYGLCLGGVILVMQALLQPGHQPFLP